MSHRPTSRHDNRLVSPEDRKNINGMHGVGQSPPARYVVLSDSTTLALDMAYSSLTLLSIRTKTIIHAPRHGQTPEDYAAATGTADRRSRPVSAKTRTRKRPSPQAKTDSPCLPYQPTGQACALIFIPVCSQRTILNGIQSDRIQGQLERPDASSSAKS